jgi:hypothetical protein
MQGFILFQWHATTISITEHTKINENSRIKFTLNSNMGAPVLVLQKKIIR